MSNKALITSIVAKLKKMIKFICRKNVIIVFSALNNVAEAQKTRPNDFKVLKLTKCIAFLNAVLKKQ